MAQITRDIVVERAEAWFPRVGYIWGGWPGTGTMCKMDDDGYGVVASDGPYYAADCSGWTSWCWNLGSKRGSSAWSANGEFGFLYRKREGFGGQYYEADFPGIQAGDVLWRSGHVVIYMGNNTIYNVSTQNWKSTPTQRGCIIQSNNFNFDGYCSFDNTWSEDYDPDTQDPVEDNMTDHQPGPYPNPTPPGDISSDAIGGFPYYYKRYTRKYTLMKQYRRH